MEAKHNHATTLHKTPLLNEGIIKDEFKALIINADPLLYQAYELRHRIIIEEWRWLPNNSTNKEYDAYDNAACHFGVYYESQIVAYARMILAHGLSQMMLQREFYPLIADRVQEIEQEIEARWSQCVEISRLIIHPEYRKKTKIILRLLYTLMAKWAISKDKLYWYFVVDRNFFESLRKQYFVVQEFATGKIVDGGDICVAACLDLAATAKNLKAKDPEGFKEMFHGHSL